MADDAALPDPPSDVPEAKKARYDAELALATKRVDAQIASEKAGADAQIASEKAEADADRARAKAEVDAELGLNAEHYKAIYEVAKASIDRARGAGENVQKAAGAIVTLYTGVLAISFSVAERPLPARGLVPAALLGAAIVLSTVYLSYLTWGESVRGAKPSSSLRENERRRAANFILWTRASIRPRRYWLRASVVALGVAVMFLPAPFVAIGKRKPASTQETVAWPKPPSDVSDPALAQILFKAQVDEAATARKPNKPSISNTGNDGWWALAGLLGLILALTVPLLIKENDSTDDDRPDRLPRVMARRGGW